MATTFQVVAPGSGFGHDRLIPVHRYLEARFEEPSIVGLSVCSSSQPLTAKNAKRFDRMRFSPIAAWATIKTADKRAAIGSQTVIPIEDEHATVLATIQGKAASRRPLAALDRRCARRLPRPWSGRRNGAARDRTEEWQRGCTERTINLPVSTREIRDR